MKLKWLASTADHSGMTTTYAPTSSFDTVVSPATGQLVTVAASVVTHAGSNPSTGTLVIVVRPDDPDHHVLAGGGTCVLRAAISVAVAGGHTRLWDDLPDRDTVEQHITALPEVVRAAAEGSRVAAVHAGCVRDGERVECVAFWFETSNGVAPLGDRRNTLGLLAAAAQRDATEAAAAAELAAAATRVQGISPDAPDAHGDGSRTFDAHDPGLDALTGLLTPERFEQALADFDDDEAALVMIDIDDFGAIEEQHGDDIANRVLRLTADRLARNTRGTDVVARLGGHRFGILLGDADRSGAMLVSKRLVSMIAEPLDLDAGPGSVTATVALAHQVGLVDVEEMVELADGAVTSGQRAGAGRLVLAV